MHVGRAPCERAPSIKGCCLSTIRPHIYLYLLPLPSTSTFYLYLLPLPSTMFVTRGNHASPTSAPVARAVPTHCVSCPLREQLAEARAERKTDTKVHAVELRASQDRFDHAMQLVQAKNMSNVASRASYFSQIVQLFIVLLLCLILFKLGRLSCVVSFSPLPLGSA